MPESYIEDHDSEPHINPMAPSTTPQPSSSTLRPVYTRPVSYVYTQGPHIGLMAPEGAPEPSSSNFRPELVGPVSYIRTQDQRIIPIAPNTVPQSSSSTLRPEYIRLAAPLNDPPEVSFTMPVSYMRTQRPHISPMVPDAVPQPSSSTLRPESVRPVSYIHTRDPHINPLTPRPIPVPQPSSSALRLETMSPTAPSNDSPEVSSARPVLYIHAQESHTGPMTSNTVSQPSSSTLGLESLSSAASTTTPVSDMHTQSHMNPKVPNADSQPSSSTLRPEPIGLAAPSNDSLEVSSAMPVSYILAQAQGLHVRLMTPNTASQPSSSTLRSEPTRPMSYARTQEPHISSMTPITVSQPSSSTLRPEAVSPAVSTTMPVSYIHTQDSHMSPMVPSTVSQFGSTLRPEHMRLAVPWNDSSEDSSMPASYTFIQELNISPMAPNVVSQPSSSTFRPETMTPAGFSNGSPEVSPTMPVSYIQNIESHIDPMTPNTVSQPPNSTLRSEPMRPAASSNESEVFSYTGQGDPSSDNPFEELEEFIKDSMNAPTIPTGAPLERSPPPAFSSAPNFYEPQKLEPLPPKITIVEEAEARVEYYNVKREVLNLERAAAHMRIKETLALLKLRRIQEVLADERVVDIENVLGRARLDVTDARRKVRAAVEGIFPFRNDDIPVS